MGTLVTVCVWLKKYWYIPVFVLGTLIAWFLFRRTGPPLEQTLAEVKAIQAEADVKKLKATLGAQYAKKVVTERYKIELEELNSKQKEQANELSGDPAKLAKFLVRAGSR